MVKISDRLKTAASLIREGAVLADVGTDHGYVPIYLLEQKKITSAIAMDINKGPLERAREHIHLYGMDAYIQTRLWDGVARARKGRGGLHTGCRYGWRACDAYLRRKEKIFVRRREN